MYLDDRLKFIAHLEIALEKARKVFMSHKRLFYSSKLQTRGKIICYLLLIRPILAYGCQIWFGIAPCTKEKIRAFERRCLKVCLGISRDPATDHRRYVSTKKVYELAKIPRFDGFIIGLIRDHIVQACNNHNNALISLPFLRDEDLLRVMVEKGLLVPETLNYLDKHKFVQGDNNSPILYHVKKLACDRIVRFGADEVENNPDVEIRYSTALPSL